MLRYCRTLAAPLAGRQYTSATHSRVRDVPASQQTPNTCGDTITRTLPTGNQTLSWNEYNRVASVTTPTGTTSYVYDADGTQLIRCGPGSTTLYLPGEEITRNNTAGTLTGPRGGVMRNEPRGDKYSEIASMVGDRVRGGENIAQVIQFMRDSGLDAADSIDVLASVGAYSLGEAKRVVLNSSTWADVRASHEDFHQSLIDDVEHGT